MRAWVTVWVQRSIEPGHAFPGAEAIQYRLRGTLASNDLGQQPVYRTPATETGAASQCDREAGNHRTPRGNTRAGQRAHGDRTGLKAMIGCENQLPANQLGLGGADAQMMGNVLMYGLGCWLGRANCQCRDRAQNVCPRTCHANRRHIVSPGIALLEQWHEG
jgi:hypothetical protein